MQTFIARWPNGDVSLVVANSEEEACLSLDEVGDPFDVNLTPLDDSRAMAVHFNLTDQGEIGFEGVSEGLFYAIHKAWPLLGKEIDALIDERIDENSDVWKQRIQAAVSRERERDFGCNAEDAANRAFGYSDDEEGSGK